MAPFTFWPKRHQIIGHGLWVLQEYYSRRWSAETEQKEHDWIQSHRCVEAYAKSRKLYTNIQRLLRIKGIKSTASFLEMFLGSQSDQLWPMVVIEAYRLHEDHTYED